MRSIFIVILFQLTTKMIGQGTIKVEVSADTIEPGKIVQVVYSIENGHGTFEPPVMDGLPLVSGPNISSSFLISNGKKSSSQSYTYMFRPEGEGEITIPPAAYTEEGKRQVIESVTITVAYNTLPRPLPDAKPKQGLKSIREKKKI